MNFAIYNSGATRRPLLVACLLTACLAFALSADDVVVRIGDADAQKAAVSKTNPDYPPMARQMHVSGPVIVEAAVSPDGEVEKVQPVSGNALLSSAAVSAVKKWKFKPFVVEGKPTKAVVRLSFNFTL